MEKRTKRKLILEDGSVFEGYAFGGEGDRVMEVVFNTSPVGYEEIVSDPSYTDQGVVMTYPLIGNYGVNTMDAESDAPSLSALIVGEYNPYPSNFRSERSLGSWLDGCGIPGLYGVDTRMLARKIRMEGSMRAFLSGAETTVPEALEAVKTRWHGSAPEKFTPSAGIFRDFGWLPWIAASRKIFSGPSRHADAP